MSPRISHNRIPSHSGRSGSALLIVLAMIVLLTGLILVFLFRSGNSVSVAGNSANTTRADLFGKGAIDSVVGDLQQEISAGSTATVYGTNTVYMPSSATNMVVQPALPSGMTTTAFPNLLKMSVPKVPFSAGDTSNGGLGRAAGTVNGSALTTTPSLNGVLISLSKWNKALLLPKASTSDTYNLAPAAGFVAPNWILVARSGANPTSWDPSLEAIPAHVLSTSPVVGRYAYVIYNEGGLLDANVAGNPISGTGAAATYSSAMAYKNVLAYADLTQLKDSSGNQLLSSADINALVGWRNYASAHAGGNFPAYTFPAQSGTTPTSFDLAMLFNFTGFLRTSNAALSNNQSDRMFLSRQQLIHFLETADSANLAQMQNVLQYLGTFSRGLSQPSFALNPNAPGINTAINPTFLSVRVGSAFTRNNGSQALVNEPLVKKRFALDRLSWLTYGGPSGARNISSPSSSANGSDYDIYALENQYGVSQQFLAQGTAQNIYNYFGLSWVADPNNGGSSEWVYSHTGTSPVSSAGSAGSIKTLSQVTGRDPDFFELLKAGICAGSVGKSYGETGAPSYQANRDTSTDGAIFQIGANIITQSQPSGYPARVTASAGGTLGTQQFCGVVDLPYVYRVREGKIRLSDSTPTYTSLPVVATGAAITSETGGIGYEVQEPEIWNPHQWKTTDVIPRPTQFRLTVVNADPTGAATPPISLAAAWRPYPVGTTYYSSPNPDDPAASPAPTPVSINATFRFGIPVGSTYLFREPTLLNKLNIPTNSSFTGPFVDSLDASTAYTSVGLTDNLRYAAVVLGQVPLSFKKNLLVGAVSATSVAGLYVVPAEYTELITGTYLTYGLQYFDGHNWITYDQKCAPVLCANSYNTWNSLSAGYGRTFNGTQVVGTELMATCFDPRTSRFGMLQSGPNGLRGNSFEYIPPYPISGSSTGIFAWAAKTTSPFDTASNKTAAQQNALWTMRPDENQGFILDASSSNPTLANGYGYDTGPTTSGWSPAGAQAIIRPGLYAQNNPAVASATSTVRYAGDTATSGPGTPGLSCFADPDGVVRRAMAAYVPPAGSPASTVPFSAGAASSLPLKPAYVFSSSGTVTPTSDAPSRPMMLNRPFRSVADLGYVFSDTPWRNLGLYTPESGNVALLDLFCIHDTEDPNGLVAGKVDLNTRQAPVIQAILAGAYEDEFAASTATSSSTTSSASNPVIGASGGAATADKIAAGLIARTSMTTTPGGPLTNIGDLVGKWNASIAAGAGLIDGGQSYTGFSGAAATSGGPPSTPPNLSSILAADSSVTGDNASYVERYREATIRALSNAGQVRVWNLMIDLVAQSGRYPASAGNLDQFVVEGQQHYWVHLAIDRLTGRVLDKQVEEVKE